MRASVVLLFVFLALAFVVAYATDEVSVYDNCAGCFVNIIIALAHTTVFCYWNTLSIYY